MNNIHDVVHTVNLILRADGEELITSPPDGSYRQQIEFLLQEYTDKIIAKKGLSCEIKSMGTIQDKIVMYLRGLINKHE
jgi:hypothetical protein